MTPGIYHNIPAADYHRLPFVSNSYLKRLAKCPANAKVPMEDTAALLFGRAAHVLILEGEDAFSSEFCLVPKIDKRTKDGKAQWADLELLAAGRNLISMEDYETILQMNASVRMHPFARLLLAEGVSETTIIFDREAGGQTLRCKARPDRTPAPEMACLLDLKTTEDAGYDAFLRSCLKFGYATQAAFYVDGYNATRGDHPAIDAFAFIAVEKKAPYRCEVYTMDMGFLMWGRGEYERLLKIEADCRKQGFWPPYQNAGAEDLIKPAWLV